MYAYERIDVMQNCCLWIGGVKVSDLDGIRDNFNITDVKGYYLGGRLADWLRLGGYDNEAARIPSIEESHRLASISVSSSTNISQTLSLLWTASLIYCIISSVEAADCG